MWRQWEHTEGVISRIPGQRQEETCLAASPNFLALGTNTGSLFWYDRRADLLARLDCGYQPLTVLALTEAVDIMVAAGSQAGNTTIFQIPRSRQAGLAANAPHTTDPIQQFCVAPPRLSSSVTALCWAINGEKLFVGNATGAVRCCCT